MDFDDPCSSWQLEAMGLLIEVFGVSIRPDKEKGWTLDSPTFWKFVLDPATSGSLMAATHQAILEYCQEYDINIEALSEEEGGTSLQDLLNELDLGLD